MIQLIKDFSATLAVISGVAICIYYYLLF